MFIFTTIYSLSYCLVQLLPPFDQTCLIARQTPFFYHILPFWDCHACLAHNLWRREGASCSQMNIKSTPPIFVGIKQANQRKDKSCLKCVSYLLWWTRTFFFLIIAKQKSDFMNSNVKIFPFSIKHTTNIHLSFILKYNYDGGKCPQNSNAKQKELKLTNIHNVVSISIVNYPIIKECQLRVGCCNWRCARGK